MLVAHVDVVALSKVVVKIIQISKVQVDKIVVYFD
jgi:hypothetical protein